MDALILVSRNSGFKFLHIGPIFIADEFVGGDDDFTGFVSFLAPQSPQCACNFLSPHLGQGSHAELQFCIFLIV
jgi:hypothetical protein